MIYVLGFGIKAGDGILKEHMQHAIGNAKYTSTLIQNELITLCEETVSRAGETAPAPPSGEGTVIEEDYVIVGVMVFISYM